MDTLRFAASAATCLTFAMLLSACQSSGQQADALSAQGKTETPTAGAQTGSSEPLPAATEAAFAPAAAGSAAAVQCATPIAGPPPKPAKGADFASATGKNLGKNVGRNLIASMGSRVAGPLGGAVAGAVAADAIRSEHDLKGGWTATDGAANCGCTLEVQSGINLQGRTVYSGKLSAAGCANPLLARAVKWDLGHTFTGYDASLALSASDGTRVATLSRDGVDYFSGTLADGTPLTIWRD